MQTAVPTEKRYGTCPLCEAICGIEVSFDAEGGVTAIRGDREDPFSRGHICPKAPALKDIQTDPDRLRFPLRRRGDDWEEIDWDTAFAYAAERLHAVQKTYGYDGVAVYLGNPNVHSLGSMIFGPQFVKLLKTRHRYSATSVDQLPHMFVAHQMFGHQLLMPIPDVDRTDYFLILGGNPLASNGSIMTAPDIRGRLHAVQARGGSVVVIDPRRTETAERADRHCFIRPGTDVWLLAAMLHVVFAEDLVRDSSVLALADGVPALRDVVAAFSPAQAAAVCGIDAATIRALAREFAGAERAVVYGRIGASVQTHGALCHWLINALNLVTGNFDRPGGAMFTQPAVDPIGGPAAFRLSRGSHGRWHSRVRGLPEVNGELPVATMAEDLEAPGEDGPRALVTSAGNPVLSTPGGQRLERVLPKLEFMLSIDFYINETTRHADLILPPTGPLERDHYDLIFHVLAVRNTAKFSPAVVAPQPGQRHDWQIFIALMRQLEHARGTLGLRGRLNYAGMRWLKPARIVDLGLRLGRYGKGFRLGRPGLSLRRLRARPHGVDLGPLQPSLPARLQTDDQRIALAPAAWVEALNALATRGDEADETERPLRLIGRRHVRNNNSWMHNAPSLMTGKPRCDLLMHPRDAEARALHDGDPAEIRSAVGTVAATITTTETVMPGVVSLPHGFGHTRPGVRLQVARRPQNAGASINDLTDPGRVDPVCGNAALNGVPVEVVSVEEASA